MKRINLETLIPYSCQEVWNILIHVRTYPKYMPYLTNVQTDDKNLHVGSIYYNTTTILWIPLRMKHTVLELRPQQKLVFDLPVPFGGSVQEVFLLQPVGGKTKLSVTVTCNMRRVPFKKLVEAVWGMRMRRMINITISNLKQ